MTIHAEEKLKLVKLIPAFVLGIGGITLFIAYTNWQAGLGLALCLWSNNIQMRKS